ncbi:MAG: hypothetical protein FWF77_06465 [Defluviitaleaceae bacterium]|nr:hypothetical protein [Defluviitaleaceae bacterium]
MNRLSVGNIAVEAQRAVRRKNKDYGDRVITLVDELVATKTLSRGGMKEMLRAREIFCDYFYYGNTEHIEHTIKNLMDFAFLERSV